MNGYAVPPFEKYPAVCCVAPCVCAERLIGRERKV